MNAHTISDGGAMHTLAITNGTRFYTRSESPDDRVSVRSAFYRREDWEWALKMYGERYPAMVNAFAGGQVDGPGLAKCGSLGPRTVAK